MFNHLSRVAALAFASVASATFAAQWTSFPVGKLDFANTFAVRSDGRFLYSEAGEVYSQNAFGTAAKTKINRGTLVFDPSFIAVRSTTSALLGAGGFGGPTGVHTFNPSLPTTAITATPLASMQNYAAVWWHHPTSGREGWIVAGGNNAVDFKHNLMFVSDDGTHAGAITSALCTYSAGLATDTSGNVFAALYELDGSPDVADTDKVLKYNAAQIDTAVAAVIAATPAPLAKGDASLVFKFDTASSIAVDGFGRIWAAGFKTSDLQVYDPATAQAFHVQPVHTALTGASGAPTYQVQTFSRSGLHYVAFLANDSFFSTNSGIAYGYALAEDLPVRQIAFATAAKSVLESGGTVTVTVTCSPAPTKKVTVPITLSGSATTGADYTTAITSVIFNPNETTKSLSVSILDDAADEPIDSETIVLKLGAAAPATHAATGVVSQHTITIADNDLRPQFAPVQTFTTGKVGTQYNYPLATIANPSGLPTTYTAKGLPDGLTIDKNTGLISGRATKPGEFSQIVVTATNSAGTSISRVYLIDVDDYPAMAHGSFLGIMERGNFTDNLGGRIEFTTTSVASFTGKVIIGKIAYPIKGDLDTTATNPVGSASYKVGTDTRGLSFSINALTGVVSGNIVNNVAVNGITGWRGLASTTLAGLHNFAAAQTGMPITSAPEGSSFAALTVTSDAKTTISGKAADGSAFTSSGLLGSGGEFIIYQALYTAPGTLFGTLHLGSDSAHAITGSLEWSKPSQSPAGTQVYPSGWPSWITISAHGGKYRPVSGTTSVLGMTESSGYGALVRCTGGGIEALTATTTANAIIAPPALVTIAAPHKLAITNTTGAFSGSFTYQVAGKAQLLAYQGLIIPNTGTADPFDGKCEGFYLLGTRSGGVSIGVAP